MPRQSQPRYLEVAEILMGEIRSGQFPVGEELPSESRLCERFQISRYTAREAIAQLERAGLIARRQGASTTVVAAASPVRYFAAVSNEEDILRYAGETILALDRNGARAVSPAMRREWGLHAAAEWVKLEGLRRLPGSSAPIGLVTVLLRGDYAGVVDELGRERSAAIFPLVAERYGLTINRIDQEFSAVEISVGAARRLRIAPGSPGLVVVRRFWAGDDGPFEVSVTVHPKDRFRYALRLER